jgi:hypothetical protein
MPDNIDVLEKFKKNYSFIKEYLDKIINSLIDNVSIIPYTMRCICKVIDILIRQKFPDISKYEKNAFMAEFIFEKCIIPILINPDYESVVSSTIITSTTKNCLINISKILRKIYRGQFFDSTIEPNYTIFNHYMIEVIQEINNFFECLIDVKLPKTLDKYMQMQNDEIPGDLTFDYFKENKEELIHIKSICFSIPDVTLIVRTLKQVSETFRSDNLLYKSIEKISNQENYLNQLIRMDPNRKFFIVFNITNNPEMVELLYPKVFKFTFTNELENNEFILKRIKFCIRLILKGLNMLNLKVYSHFINANTTEKFFEALNQIIQLEEFNDREYNDKIPINWYSLYMTSNIQFLSDEYRGGDYNKLYQELLAEEKKEIGFLNTKSNLVITKYGMNIRCVEKIIENIRKYFMKVKQIEKYLRIDHFIRNTTIEVCLRKNNKEEPEANKSGIMDTLFFFVKRNRNNTIIEKDKGEQDDK